jgi:hypothetical protein
MEGDWKITRALLWLLCAQVFIMGVAGILLFYKANAVLVTEIVPQDQHEIPLPKEGDHILVYGAWVRDEGHMIRQLGWNEIHPVRYIHDFNSGKSGGSMPYAGPLMGGVWEPSRLVVIDSANPYRNVTGIVDDVVFEDTDGDVHIEIIPDKEYRNLLQYNDADIPIKFGLLRLIALGCLRLLPFSAGLLIIAAAAETFKKYKKQDTSR